MRFELNIPVWVMIVVIILVALYMPMLSAIIGAVYICRQLIKGKKAQKNGGEINHE